MFVSTRTPVAMPLLGPSRQETSMKWKVVKKYACLPWRLSEWDPSPLNIPLVLGRSPFDIL